MPSAANAGLLALLFLMGGAAAQTAGDRPDALVAGPVGRIQWFEEIGFVPPVGWTVKPGRGFVEMDAPVAPADRPCTVWLMSPIPAQGNLEVQAENLVNGLFARQMGPYYGSMGPRPDVKNERYEGVSGAGWQYVDLYGRMGAFSAYARALLARTGNRVVPMIGLARNLKCSFATDHDNVIWTLLFHSLQLPGFHGDSPALKHQLVGEWTSVSSTVANSQTFLADGSFDASGYHNTYSVSPLAPDRLTVTTQGATHDGTWEVHGDRLTKTYSTGPRAGKTLTYLFSIVHQPNPYRGQFATIVRWIDVSDDPRSPYVGHLVKSR